MRAAALAAVLASAGCSYLGTATSFDPGALSREAGWLAAEGVVDVRQGGDEDCGEAALAVLLAYWGREPASCPPAPGRGTRAGRLREELRRQGLAAFLIRGELADLRRELERGRPVLVGLVKPFADGAWTHYEVVVAVHPGRGRVVTLDPARGWRENGAAGFLAEWEPAGRLALVVPGPSGH